MLGVLIGLVILQWKRIAGYYRNRGRMFQVTSTLVLINIEVDDEPELEYLIDHRTLEKILLSWKPSTRQISLFIWTMKRRSVWTACGLVT